MLVTAGTCMGVEIWFSSSAAAKASPYNYVYFNLLSEHFSPRAGKRHDCYHRHIYDCYSNTILLYEAHLYYLVVHVGTYEHKSYIYVFSTVASIVRT